MKRLPITKSRHQAGDTIVEVLIVLAVLGLGLSISYATANRGLSQSRNAEEHSEALGLLNSQVEVLRSALVKKVVVPVNSTPPAGSTSLNFCMSSLSDPAQIIGFGSYNVPDNPSADTAVGSTTPPTMYPAPCVNGFYHTSMVYDASSGSYRVRIRWDGPGQLGRQQEEFNYKVNQVAAGYTPPPYVPSPTLYTPTLTASVQKIQANADNTAPNCSSGNGRTTLSNAGVTLSTSQTGNTGSSGLATITDLVDGQAYTVTAAATSYTFCSSSSATAKTVAPYNRIDVLVASKCTTQPASTGPPYNHYTTAYAWVLTGPHGWRDWRYMPLGGGQTSPPAAFWQYEYSGGTNDSSQPVYYTQYGWIPPAFGYAAFYLRAEYQPYSVFLGNYGDPVAAYNTCN